MLTKGWTVLLSIGRRQLRTVYYIILVYIPVTYRGIYWLENFQEWNAIAAGSQTSGERLETLWIAKGLPSQCDFKCLLRAKYSRKEDLFGHESRQQDSRVKLWKWSLCIMISGLPCKRYPHYAPVKIYMWGRPHRSSEVTTTHLFN